MRKENSPWLLPYAANGECLEHRVIRNNLADITRSISSDSSAGPTWFAQKLEEKAFIANAASAVVTGCSSYEQTSKLMDAVKGKICTSQEPNREFEKFLKILESTPPLVDLARKLLMEYGEICTHIDISLIASVTGRDDPWKVQLVVHALYFVHTFTVFHSIIP